MYTVEGKFSSSGQEQRAMDQGMKEGQSTQTEAFLRKALNELEIQLKQSGEEIQSLRTSNEELRVQLDERVMMTEVLHENEQQFRALVASIPGAVYRFRISSTWVIEFISDAIEEITAFPASRFRWQPVKSLRNIIHPEDKVQVEQAIKEGMEPLKTFSVEYRVLDAKGRIRWVVEAGQAVYSAQGEPFWLDGVITDVSERKFAQDALEKANQKLERLAMIDGLTQVANRRQFDECLNTEWLRAKRNKNVLSLILCDIDFFKLYNDNYGHQEGDKCLRAVAQAIQSVVKRPADLVARYGGEEFVVALPDTYSEGAVCLAEQIREKVGSLRIPHVRSQAVPYVTLSLGVSSMAPRGEIPPENLIVAADEALYTAKKQGRNRVVLSPNHCVHADA
jgi:two-component system, cell cycle response regulator